MRRLRRGRRRAHDPADTEEAGGPGDRRRRGHARRAVQGERSLGGEPCGLLVPGRLRGGRPGRGPRHRRLARRVPRRGGRPPGRGRRRGHSGQGRPVRREGQGRHPGHVVRGPGEDRRFGGRGGPLYAHGLARGRPQDARVEGRVRRGGGRGHVLHRPPGVQGRRPGSCEDARGRRQGGQPVEAGVRPLGVLHVQDQRPVPPREQGGRHGEVRGGRKGHEAPRRHHGRAEGPDGRRLGADEARRGGGRGQDILGGDLRGVRQGARREDGRERQGVPGRGREPTAWLIP